MTEPQRRGHSGRATHNNQRYRNELKKRAEAGEPLAALTVLHHDIVEALREAGVPHYVLQERMDIECPWRGAFDAHAH